MTTKRKKRDNMRPKPTSFAAWVRNVVAVGRKHGHTDGEIRQWIKVYASKKNIPYGTIMNQMYLNDLRIRGRRRLSPISRAAMGRQIYLLPKMRYLKEELHKEIEAWSLAILRTLKATKNQGEDISEARAMMIKSIKEAYAENPFSEFITADEFIARLVPELQISQ